MGDTGTVISTEGMPKLTRDRHPCKSAAEGLFVHSMHRH